MEKSVKSDRTSPSRAFSEIRNATVAVTIYGPAGASRSAVARAADGVQALRLAAEDLRERWPGEPPRRVQIEMAAGASVRLSKEASLDLAWRRVPLGEIGVHAAAARWERRFFPAAWLQSGWALENRALDQLAAELAMNEGSPPPLAEGPLELWTFPVTGFVETADRRSTARLSYGRQARVDWKREDLLEGAEAAGRWLAHAQLPSGRYHYHYDALLDEFDDARYNLPRHCGTTYSLFQLHGRRPDPKVFDVGRRALGYLEPITGPGRTPGARYIRDEAGRGTLGSSSLALVAWSERLNAAPSSAGEKETARTLARWILEMQRPDGSFRVAIGPGTDPEASDADSYYPGEALFALLRLHGAAPDPKWLEAARRGVRHRMAQQKLKMPVYDTWFIHALNELNAVEPSQELVEHGALIARRMVATLKDEAAGRYAPMSLGAMCSRVEGVVSSARLFRSSGKKVPGDLESFLKSAGSTILHAQYTPENSYYLPNPERAQGAFMGTTLSHKARIDVIHHCLSAYLGLSEVLY